MYNKTFITLQNLNCRNSNTVHHTCAVDSIVLPRVNTADSEVLPEELGGVDGGRYYKLV